MNPIMALYFDTVCFETYNGNNNRKLIFPSKSNLQHNTIYDAVSVADSI